MFEQIVARLYKNSIIGDFRPAPGVVESWVAKWQEPHRFYHSLCHLNELLDMIDMIDGRITAEDRAVLQMVALFHDIVYDPRRKDNEEKSCNFFYDYFASKRYGIHGTVVDIIEDTAHHHKARSELSKLFCKMDTASLFTTDQTVLIGQEMRLFKEYQFVPFEDYRKRRKDFLTVFEQNWKSVNPQITSNVQFILNFLKQFRPKIGVYAGSYNPFHNGHMNILEKAEQIFDKVIIAVGINPEKKNNESVHARRLILHEKVLPFHQVELFEGLLPDFIRDLEKTAEITLIRGLRNGYDLNAETNLLRYMQDIHPQVKVVYILCDKQFDHISSSSIRSLIPFKKEIEKGYLPTKFAYAKY